MEIKFDKYQGAGNDFILLDNREGFFSDLTASQRKALCDRYKGIGADGLILIDHSAEVDFEMRYFNSDGNSSTLCGNGGRCAVAFTYQKKIIGHETLFRAIDGHHKAQIVAPGVVRLEMQEVKSFTSLPEAVITDTGSPHYVKLVDDVSAIDVQKEGAAKIVAFILGGLLMVALGTVVDRWFYGEWVFSPWQYFEQNILLDKASTFGVDPWWKYFQEIIIKGIPPFGLFYLLAMAVFVWQKPKELLTWVAIPFVGIHLLIAHKELRFLYVLLPFLPIALSTALQWWEDHRPRPLWSTRAYRIAWRTFWVHNALLTLFIMFWPIIMEMNIYRTIYDQYQEPITIYGIEDHPYKAALYISYYKRPSLCVAQVSSLDKLPLYGKSPYLLAVDHRDDYPIDSLPGHKKLIYSSFPDWIMPLNFNDWMSRSRWWLVYEIRERSK